MNNKLTENILKSIPLVLFVVDSDFKLKYINNRFLDVFRCETKDGNQVGQMIGCITLLEGGTCTKEELCAICGLRNALQDCISKGRDIFHKIIEKTISINGKLHTISLKLTMNKVDGEDSYVCVVDDVTEIIEISEKERVENKQMLKEISKAKNIQRDLLPRSNDFSGIDFEYIYKQLKGIGGDFFSIYKIDNSHTGLYIADVSGHGISCGMLTMFLHENYNKKTKSPSAALYELYKKFNRYRFSQDSYITILSVIIDTENNTLTYANAGHSEPILLYTRGKVFTLTERGAPISNWFNTSTYRDSTFLYNKGDRLMLFTDGVVDMRNGSNEEFSVEPLQKRIIEKCSIEKIISNINHDIEQFTQQPQDDMTVLLLEINK